MKKKQVQILSFIGGLVFVSVLATALILNNKKLKAEVEAQFSKVLDTTKDVIGQAQFVVGKISKISGELKSDKDEDEAGASRASFKALDDGYDSMWRSTEIQAAEFQKWR